MMIDGAGAGASADADAVADAVAGGGEGNGGDDMTRTCACSCRACPSRLRSLKHCTSLRHGTERLPHTSPPSRFLSLPNYDPKFANQNQNIRTEKSQALDISRLWYVCAFTCPGTSASTLRARWSVRARGWAACRRDPSSDLPPPSLFCFVFFLFLRVIVSTVILIRIVIIVVVDDDAQKRDVLRKERGRDV
eukprot:2379374-Rhodomonas_salina.1